MKCCPEFGARGNKRCVHVADNDAALTEQNQRAIEKRRKTIERIPHYYQEKYGACTAVTGTLFANSYIVSMCFILFVGIQSGMAVVTILVVISTLPQSSYFSGATMYTY